MNWTNGLLAAGLLTISAISHAADMTRDELQGIIAQPPSADVVAELRMYRAGDCRFSLKITPAEGNTVSIEYSARQSYVDGRYVVITPQPIDGVPRHMVRAYDQQQRLYYGWDLYEDGTVLRQSGMYDPERKIMAWFNENTLHGHLNTLRSLQSFADPALVAWRAQFYVDKEFRAAIQGGCRPVPADTKP